MDFSKAGQYTVGQWTDVWHENCAKVKARPSSRQTYRGYIDNHKSYIGGTQLSEDHRDALETKNSYRTISIEEDAEADFNQYLKKLSTQKKESGIFEEK